MQYSSQQSLHGVVIMYVGGDFMRLRLLLPALFLLSIVATGGSTRLQTAGVALALASTVLIMQLPPS